MGEGEGNGEGAVLTAVQHNWRELTVARTFS
jgi:hypothetical protein